MDQLISQLRDAIAQAILERASLAREDPVGRMLSIAITEMESAENWLVRARHTVTHTGGPGFETPGQRHARQVAEAVGEGHPPASVATDDPTGDKARLIGTAEVP